MRKLVETLDRVTAIITNLFMNFSAACTIAMFLIVLVDVIYRILFHASLISSVELGGYALAFLTFCGLAWTYRSDGMIRVDLFYGRFSKKVKRWMDPILQMILFGYFSIITRYFWSFVVYSKVQKLISLDIMATPLWIPRLVIAIGATAFTVVIGWDFIRSVINIFCKLPEADAVQTK